MPPNRVAPALLAALCLSLPACATSGGFTPDKAHGFVARQSAGHRHHVYLPTGWSADKAWPVIVYLHGGGERGDDGDRPTQVGLGPVIARSGGAFPYVVVFPQCIKSQFWAEAPMRARVIEALDDAMREFHGDPARVYLTGHSMGGYGTWLIAARNPGRFAALAPIAGGVKPPFGYKVPEDDLFKKGLDPEAVVAQAVGHTPVWIFHGKKDWLVPIDNARRMLAHVKELGGDARLTELEGVGHRSDIPAYDLPAFWEWLGSHKLPEAQAATR